MAQLSFFSMIGYPCKHASDRHKTEKAHCPLRADTATEKDKIYLVFMGVADFTLEFKSFLVLQNLNIQLMCIGIKKFVLFSTGSFTHKSL